MGAILRVYTLASRSGLYGGPAETANRQAGIAADLGHRVHVVAGHLPGDDPTETTDAYGSTYVRVRRPKFMREGLASLLSIRLVRVLWFAVAESDIVHVSFSRELVPTCAAVIAIMRGKRLVLQPHGMLTSRSGLKHQVVDVISKRIYERADVVVALTEQEQEDLAAWCPKYNGQYVICGNPVPRHGRAHVRVPSRHPVAVFIARLHPRKRVQTFVEAAGLSLDSNNVRFVVLGPDGGQLDLVLDAARNLDNFQYAGAVSSDEVLDFIDGADVFVLTSFKEPWGNVLVSALSLGVPVIVTSSTALAGLIRRYGAGVIVPDGDAQSLRAALETLLGDRHVFAACSHGALEMVRENMGEGVQQVFLHQLYQ